MTYRCQWLADLDSDQCELNSLAVPWIEGILLQDTKRSVRSVVSLLLISHNHG